MITVTRLSILLWIYLLVSVFTGCGSAEAIKGYRYPTKKINLEKAVVKVLKENPNIYVDTSEPKIKVRLHPENPYSDTTTKMINASEYHEVHGADSIDFFEDLRNHTKIKIKVGGIENDYVFHYKGTRCSWDSSATSEILLSYAQDKFGNTLEQGHNETGQFNSKTAKDFTDLFEREVIDKIDKELNLKHSIGRVNE